MLHSIILGLHLTLCFVLIVLVLLQQGKGADAGIALGGGSNTLFGASGATSMIVKLTTAIAVLFMGTSIFLVRSYATIASNGPVAIEVANPGLGGGVAAPAAAPAAQPIDAAVPDAPPAVPVEGAVAP